MNDISLPAACGTVHTLYDMPVIGYTVLRVHARSCRDFGEFGRIACAMRATPKPSEAWDPLMVPLGQGLAPHMPQAGHITCP